jgi:hypothetical protein
MGASGRAFGGAGAKRGNHVVLGAIAAVASYAL